MIDKLKAVTLDSIPPTNPSLVTYFSLSTNEKNASSAFESDAVAGQLIGYQLKKQLASNFDEKSFIEEVLEKFKEVVSSPEALEIIKEIYFQDEKLPVLAPLMYMSKPYKSLDKKTKKSLKIFFDMLQPTNQVESFSKELNFLEQRIFETFEQYITPSAINQESSSYVSYLDRYFTQDFSYLLSNAQYFQKHIDMFLKFYFFIYSTQLTLNIQTAPLEKPSLKELYFILNYEQASSERKHIVRQGYRTLKEKIRYLFPYLSLLELLSKIVEDKNLKLYHLANLEDSQENRDTIIHFVKLFRKKRGLATNQLLSFQTNDEACNYLLQSTYEQFKGDKKAVIDRFILAYEKQVASSFVQSRGRFGKVLILDQDMLLLLTNLSIGPKQKLRFQDLLREFQKRGVYFDSKSEDALLELYERVGNIERKSDSGDAVYVCRI